MPRINRRRPVRIQKGLKAGSPGWMQLAWGCSVGPSPFATREAEKESWFEHREALLASSEASGGPGQRPSAFWRYELQIAAPCCAALQAVELFRRKLLRPGEAEEIERTHDRYLTADWFSGADDPDHIRRMKLGLQLLRKHAEEFAGLAEWHKLRRRPKVAEVYRLRAENFKTVADQEERIK